MAKKVEKPVQEPKEQTVLDILKGKTKDELVELADKLNTENRLLKQELQKANAAILKLVKG